MRSKVLDTWALVAFFEDEPGAEEVEELLIKAEEGKQKLLLSVITWGEIYSAILRGASKEVADHYMKEVAAMPIELVPIEDDLEIVRQASIYRATTQLPYSGCFAASLAKIRNAELVTGDSVFNQLEGQLRIHWLARDAQGSQ
jgi:ribonuclease VapC